MSDAQEKIAVFPGAFDPPTHGHLDIINRASSLFGRLIVAVGHNPEKTPWFTAEQRVQMMQEASNHLANVSIESYDGLTMDFVRRVGASVMVRGIRDSDDLREELRIATVNKLVGGVETVFLMSDEQHALTSSTLIKQIVELGGPDHKRLLRLVPQVVVDRLMERFRHPR
jgi:pantetheine-phosphate adenylyltransferase